MKHCFGIYVQLALSSICILDAAGVIVRGTKVANKFDALVGFLRGIGLPIVNVRLKAGPLVAVTASRC